MTTMNAMTVDSSTGFLQSPTTNHLSSFSAHKKQLMIEYARKYWADQKIMPAKHELCEAVGIDIGTLDRHLKIDSAFCDAWKEMLLIGESFLENKMYEYGKGKSGYMHMITWLRRQFPERWNPEYKVTAQVDVNFVNSLADKAKAIEAETVDTSTPTE
jgi:hypothetical protein